MYAFTRTHNGSFSKWIVDSIYQIEGREDTSFLDQKGRNLFLQSCFLIYTFLYP